MKKRKVIILVVGIIICFLALIIFGGLLGTSNLSYAQKYKFDVSKEELIRTVENFKSKNSIYNVAADLKEADSLDNSTSRYNIFMYYNDESTIICFYIDGDTGKSYINFVSINQGLKSSEYKVINKDLSRDDNKRIKKEFENRILDKLGLPYKDKGNDMFIFWK